MELNASDMVFTCEGRERCPVQQCIGEELAIGNGVYQYFNQIYHLVTHELGFLRYLEEIFPERPVWLRNVIYYAGFRCLKCRENLVLVNVLKHAFSSKILCSSLVYDLLENDFGYLP